MKIGQTVRISGGKFSVYGEPAIFINEINGVANVIVKGKLVQSVEVKEVVKESYLSILRDLLKHNHNTYRCNLNLDGMYGNIEIKIEKNREIVFRDSGQTLEKRFRKAIKFLLADIYGIENIWGD